MRKNWFCLLLVLMLGCAVSLAEGTASVAPYTPSDAEIAYASLLGLDEPHLVYSYTADGSSALLVTVYAWQENTWKAANTQHIPLDCAQGRIALFPEQLETQLRIAVQCPHGDTALVCHPLFSLPAAPTSSQVSLCEQADIALGEELPVVVQGMEDMTLDAFASPSVISGSAYAITLTFIPREVTP